MALAERAANASRALALKNKNPKTLVTTSPLADVSRRRSASEIEALHAMCSSASSDPSSAMLMGYHRSQNSTPTGPTVTSSRVPTPQIALPHSSLPSSGTEHVTSPLKAVSPLKTEPMMMAMMTSSSSLRDRSPDMVVQQSSSSSTCSSSRCESVPLGSMDLELDANFLEGEWGEDFFGPSTMSTSRS
mmetsp:Transcript_14201/g.23501  ORF Transcript_14201/g.23501 Transcript_14201/m.23501 type:complete len:188 (+) Transcript_14201:103-666(+)